MTPPRKFTYRNRANVSGCYKRRVTGGRLFQGTQAKLLRMLLISLLTLTFVIPAHARKRRPRARPAPAVSFVPSPEIDERVRQEVERATTVLTQLEQANLLANPYLVQAIYFHNGFLEKFAADRSDADPSLRISAKLCQLITPEVKQLYLRMLREVYEADLEDVPAREFTAPVPVLQLPKRMRRAHSDAVDLFVPEGTPVQAAARGVVIFAQDGWTINNPFSTSTWKGGNTVIVFDPATDRFYRYAHLETVQVNPGTLVEAGQILGTVGHSGVHASMPGHGRHLHFEINQYQDGIVRALHADQLRTMFNERPPAMIAGVPAPTRP